MSGPVKSVLGPKGVLSAKDDPEQSKRFIEAAKEAESDETEAGADRAFKKVAKPKPADRR